MHESPHANALTTTNGFTRRVWFDESIEVFAKRSDVRDSMIALDAWRSWVPGVAAVWHRKNAPVGVGTTFGLVLEFPVLRRVVLPCTITRWDAGCLQWGGGPAWSGVRHTFELEDGGDRTRIRHREVATGLLGVLFRPFESFAYNFDHGWSEALRKRFGARDG